MQKLRKRIVIAPQPPAHWTFSTRRWIRLLRKRWIYCRMQRICYMHQVPPAIRNLYSFLCIRSETTKWNLMSTPTICHVYSCFRKPNESLHWISIISLAIQFIVAQQQNWKFFRWKIRWSHLCVNSRPSATNGFRFKIEYMNGGALYYVALAQQHFH